MRVFLLIILLISAAVVFIKKPPSNTQTPVSSFIAEATVPKETEVKNLDGSKKLVLTEEGSVFISDDKSRRLLYSGTNLSLPQNAWAPDDNYVFIKQDATFLVFKTSGEPFAGGEQFLDVVSLFVQKQPERIFKDATGWDGVGLMHVVSDNLPAGRQDTSFWFDVASKGFLQLY
ncbi:MAG: hypothetical protein ACD_48C00070G0002 [uncultured bacterium]|uniref:Dipeptidylpeptidase IV N-terminal domain-containing protein n=1 Tax=Candidatus Gottesmanbacteria bacterium RIFCSPLOWO2_01_FULL_43_11b TaxID=1798392 RepID=A0A1F6AGG0_9BACT|nr:MAG: hypothetical protein ACD_48C00070G0002 [uncultured bacterium]OGG23838.1 MAG: hypothetical protein A3A79_01380 [Candidatus Gottesmanbacteria bacterium RIFCSPLOWO2_01_FULL_43_11b]